MSWIYSKFHKGVDIPVFGPKLMEAGQQSLNFIETWTQRVINYERGGGRKCNLMAARE